jgi:hypothetical protein
MDEPGKDCNDKGVLQDKHLDYTVNACPISLLKYSLDFVSAYLHSGQFAHGLGLNWLFPGPISVMRVGYAIALRDTLFQDGNYVAGRPVCSAVALAENFGLSLSF